MGLITIRTQQWMIIFTLMASTTTELYVTPYNASLTANNIKSSTDNLAVSGENKTPIAKASFHQGNPWALNDGVKNVNADDWNGEAKTESCWGYTWGRLIT
jgi:hypothetical protein